jgi:DNA (cytosine-5)-methyltransferase 1
MKEKIMHIPELHNNDYSFMEVLGGLCKEHINHENDILFTDIAKYWNKNNKNNKSNLTAVDLFCGCGGISKGLELAGINVIAGLDFFKEAGETYKTNFNHKFVYGDITKNETKDALYKTIKDELKGKQLNIVAGGFPCQGFSMSGRRDMNDPRNKLYLEVVDIVKTLNPEFIFLENVKGLISMDGGKVKQRILQDFQDIGYNIQAYVLNAADYETPQKRERVVFIGNRIGKKILYPKPIIQNGKYKTTKDAIADLMNKKEDKEFSHFITKHTKEMQERLMNVKEGKGLYANYSDAWKKCPWNEASCTIKENHGGVNIHPKLPRVLTVRECARIQSFPDNFLFKGTKSKQLVQIGNAVPPNLSKAVALAILKSYEQN